MPKKIYSTSKNGTEEHHDIPENEDKGRLSILKSFKCPKNCGKSYKTRKGVALHKLYVHTPKGDWPYVCKLCGLKFTKKI